jgi:sugar transferase (PEP-CTERM/EpsH1 system associated)
VNVPPRLNVLFLTHRLPYAPNRGDRTRAYHLLKVLSGHANVTLVSLVHSDQEAAETHRIEALTTQIITARVPAVMKAVHASRALLTGEALTTALLESRELGPALDRLLSKNPPDVVLAYCSSMARFAIEPRLRKFPLVIDMVDADSAKWTALAETRQWPMRWIYKREGEALSRLERDAMLAARATVAVNAREVELLSRLAPAARIDVIGVGVDLTGLAPPHPPASSTRVVFTGVMNYEPNVAGAIWMAKQVWPLVRRSLPSVELRLAGSSPSRSVRALHDPGAGIVVTGSLPDIRPELWDAAVAVAPLLTARGVQNKVLEAVAAGLPCVVTPQVAAGLPEEVVPAVWVASDPKEFAGRVVTLLQMAPGERRAIAQLDLSALSWERRMGPMVTLLREAAARP